MNVLLVRNIEYYSVQYRALDCIYYGEKHLFNFNSNFYVFLLPERKQIFNCLG